MVVVQMGTQWTLVVGEQRLEFRHDGRGAITMQSGGGAWRLVTSHWEQQSNLCWDGVCARGPIPLD